MDGCQRYSEGSRWEDEIFEGIINSDYVILCLSPEYFERETTCLVECYVARGYGKILLPLIVPYDKDENIFWHVNEHEETRGIDLVNFLNFRSLTALGLPQSHQDLVNRLISAIKTLTPVDIDYDVYVSHRWQHAELATCIADGLNADGIHTFIATRSVDAGVDWRHVSWSAMLRAKCHIVVLSPDVPDSQFIKNEVLVTRTQKDACFIPVLPKQFALDQQKKSEIRDNFDKSKNLSILNDIQWFTEDVDCDTLVAELIEFIRDFLNKNNQN